MKRRRTDNGRCCKKNEDEEMILSIYSADRETDTTVSNPRFTIDNGPLYVKRLAVSSCSMFNTIPNVRDGHNTIVWSAESVADGSGEFSYSLPVGQYTLSELAAALEAGMITAMSSLTNMTLTVTASTITGKLTFDFDANHDYTSIREVLHVPTSSYLHADIHGIDAHMLFDNGQIEVNAFAATMASKMTTVLQQVLPARSYLVTYDRTTKRITINQDGGAPPILFEIYKSFPNSINTLLGILADTGQIQGMNTVALPVHNVSLLPLSSLDTVLHFGNGGTVTAQQWVSGVVNLGSALIARFQSTALSDVNHITVDQYHSTSFWSMPIVSGFNQLQTYQPNHLHWISYEGGREINEIDLKIVDQYGTELTNLNTNWVMEVRMISTNEF